MDFENYRLKNNIIPPEGSNSFYDVSNGRINILCQKEDPEDYRFELLTYDGTVETGDGNLFVSGDTENKDRPYKHMTVIAGTKLVITQAMTVTKGTLHVHGTLELAENSELMVYDGGQIIFYTDSNFVVNDNIKISVDNKSHLLIFGQIDVCLSMVDYIVRNKGVEVDSAAIINVGQINIKDRAYSLTDYETSLRSKIINKNSQGEYNNALCKLGYNWIGGSPVDTNHILNLTLLWGEIILGDFKLSILGFPIEKMQDRQIINQLNILENTSLIINEEYNGKRYVRPELYIGTVIGDNGKNGIVNVYGKIIADGKNAAITLDRGGELFIHEGAEVILKNNAVLNNTYNEGKTILHIDGKLIIDNIEQIKSLAPENVMFGQKGKLIILNKYPSRKVLWTTPCGIIESDLYRIFMDRLQNIEYHIEENTGIGIDMFYEYFGRDMNIWYAGMRLEKAIYKGLIVWNKGFIELNNDIIPWADTNCTLYDASKILKNQNSNPKLRLQEVVDRLKYINSGDIIFRFIKGNEFKDITLKLDGVKMTNIINRPVSNTYIITSDNDGTLYMHNNVNSYDTENIIKDDSVAIEVNEGENDVVLPKYL